MSMPAKGFLAVSDMRVVLDVFVADVALDRFTRTALIEHQIVEVHRRLLARGHGPQSMGY
jgi:hypothetical protein